MSENRKLVKLDTKGIKTVTKVLTADIDQIGFKPVQEQYVNKDIDSIMRILDSHGVNASNITVNSQMVSSTVAWSMYVNNQLYKNHVKGANVDQCIELELPHGNGKPVPIYSLKGSANKSNIDTSDIITVNDAEVANVLLMDKINRELDTNKFKYVMNGKSRVAFSDNAISMLAQYFEVDQQTVVNWLNSAVSRRGLILDRYTGLYKPTIAVATSIRIIQSPQAGPVAKEIAKKQIRAVSTKNEIDLDEVAEVLNIIGQVDGLTADDIEYVVRKAKQLKVNEALRLPSSTKTQITVQNSRTNEPVVNNYYTEQQEFDEPDPLSEEPVEVVKTYKTKKQR